MGGRNNWLSYLTPKSMAYAIDGFLGTWLTNPLVSCTVMTGLGLYSMSLSLHMYSNYGAQVFIERSSKYAVDICFHFLNLLFIWRFPSCSKKGLLVQSNLIFEGLLWVTSNVITLIMMQNSGIWLRCDGNFFFRLIMWSSLICPYAIFLVDAMDLVFSFPKHENDKTSKWVLIHSQQEKPAADISNPSLLHSFLHNKPSITKLLVDTNNAFLAVFIAQSFANIRVEVPFLESNALNSVFVACSYLFKLHLVHMFVLYETVVAVFEIEDLSAYSELYMPVSFCDVKTWPSQMRKYNASVMTAWTSFMIAYDLVLLVLSL